MTFTYDAGSATPGYAGLISWPSLRVNDGTFRPLVIPPITESAPVRVGSTPSPEGGGVVSDPVLDVWSFEVAAWIYTEDIADMQAAVDYLKSKVNAWNGWQTVTFDAPDWAEPRRMTLQVNGQLQVTVPDKGTLIAPERVFSVPVIAADPRLYGQTQQTVTVTTSTAVTNDGNYGAPFTVRFNGPQTDPQINKDGTSGSAKVKYVGTITSGHWVEFNTLTGEAVDDTGATAYSGISASTARRLAPGSTAWTKSNASGAGTTQIIFRNTWA